MVCFVELFECLSHCKEVFFLLAGTLRVSGLFRDPLILSWESSSGRRPIGYKVPVPCPHRGVFISPDSRFRIREKRKEFHPLGLPLLGLTCWEAFRIRQRVALAGTRQLSRQVSACSLKLSQTEMRLQGFIGGSRQRHTREQRDRRQCRQLYRREKA